MAAPSPQPPLTWRQRLPFHAYRAAAAIARGTPAPVAGLLATLGGRVFEATSRERRETVARHLQRVHEGRLRPAELRRAVRCSFRSYAHYWKDAFRLDDPSPAELDAVMECEGLGHIYDGLAAGRGVLLALPHLGSWDLAGAWMVRALGVPITVVVEPLDPPELFEWFVALRAALGFTIVPLGADAGKGVLHALHANELVCLLSDRDIGGGGVEVEFFGEHTTLPAGPATLALRTGAPLLPTAIYDDGRLHRAVVRPALALERTGRLRDDVQRVTQALAHELEHLIRRAPEQWHLFQPNWPSDPGYRA